MVVIANHYPCEAIPEFKSLNAEGKMNKSKNPGFKAKRSTWNYRQTIHAAPGVVFPLLCPVREAEWLDGWKYEMIYSKSGLAEEGCIFSTPCHGEEDTVWVISRHDRENHLIDFIRFTPDSRICVLKVAVTPKDETVSTVDISYTYTGLTVDGNAWVDNFTEDTFLDAVKFWEMSLNHFLKTGAKLER
jgi:hypothetical protein